MRQRQEKRGGRSGLVDQLRSPPGGRNTQIMLFAILVDRTGSGLWASSSMLYFILVTRLSVGEVGLLLGIAGIVGIVGSPIAGRLADRFPVRPVLLACHVLRFAALVSMLFFTSFDALLPIVALTYFGDRGAKALETIFATRAAERYRATYQGLSRSAANVGYALGAGLAAIFVAIGSITAYRTVVLGDAASFLFAAALVWRVREPRRNADPTECYDRPEVQDRRKQARLTIPWRDPGYLLFVILDIPMNIDNSVLFVGIPLWLVNRTSAPHALVPFFLIINTVLVVTLQLRVSRWGERPACSIQAIVFNGALMCFCCTLVSFTVHASPYVASAALVVGVFAATLAELMRSVSSWELSVLLAPIESRASYLGVAGMSQSIQKAVGPPLLTSVVFTFGPAGWAALGAVVALLAAVQRTACRRRLHSRRFGPALVTST